MSVVVTKLRRLVVDLTNSDWGCQYSDPDGIVIRETQVLSAYKNNPFAINDGVLAQTIGIVGDRVIGGVGSMPFTMVADGKEYSTAASPDIFVNPEFRKTGFALELIEDEWNTSSDKIEVDFYVSPQARKVVGLMGGAVFDIAQFAIVRKSALFFARRLPKLFSGLVCFLMDLIFAMHRSLLGIVLTVRAFGCQLVVDDEMSTIEEFCKLVEKNPHRFRNLLTPKMFEWLRDNDFKSVEKAEKHLWRFVKGGNTLGFVYTRYSDDGQRGRILDWEMTPGNESKTALLLMLTALKLANGRSAAVVSIGNADSATVRELRRWLPRLPTQAATVGVGDGSALIRHNGWNDPKNWRIRPLMGDSALY